ncbi:MAG: PilZ domain-containing protein [Acidobacteria bacterium]|nr:PilZ domain-containing protein [Acidobacteriota bacterium]
MDARIGPRNPLNRRVKLTTRVVILESNGKVRMETIDLGPGGALCLSPAAVPMGRFFPCRIEIGEGGRRFWVEMEALVVRSEYHAEGYRIGLKFSRINRGIREALKRFLDEMERRSGRSEEPAG